MALVLRMRTASAGSPVRSCSADHRVSASARPIQTAKQKAARARKKGTFR